LTDKEHTLGLGEKGVTKYFSSNCSNEDSDKVNRFFKEKNIEGYINRVIKTVNFSI
jgi:dipeptidyl-peptidase-3